jgi:uncharacterized protein YdcH (DUF465 family)
MKLDVIGRYLTHLEARHRDLKTAVTELDRRSYLTPAEQREVADLKKEKLLTKDRIVALRRSEPPTS